MSRFSCASAWPGLHRHARTLGAGTETALKPLAARPVPATAPTTLNAAVSGSGAIIYLGAQAFTGSEVRCRYHDQD